MALLTAETFRPVTLGEELPTESIEDYKHSLARRAGVVLPSQLTNSQNPHSLRHTPLPAVAVYRGDTQVEPRATKAWLARAFIHMASAPTGLSTVSVEVDKEGKVIKEIGNPYTHAHFKLNTLDLHSDYESYDEAQTWGVLKAIGSTLDLLEAAHQNPIEAANRLVA